MKTLERPRHATIVNNIQLDRGPIHPNNTRLQNQLFLSTHFPSYFAPLVLPDDQTLKKAQELSRFPVMALYGQRWKDLLDDPNISLAEHFFIAKTTLIQVTDVLENTGVLLRDRQPINVIYTPEQEVKQVDTDIVLDFVSDSVLDMFKINIHIPDDIRGENLLSRRTPAAPDFTKLVLHRIVSALCEACLQRERTIETLYASFINHLDALTYIQTVGGVVKIYRRMIDVLEKESHIIPANETNLVSADYAV